MKNWFRAVSGTVRLRVRCARPERLLNLCAKEGVPMWDPACPDPHTLLVTVPAPMTETVESLAARCGGELTAGRTRGLPVLRRLAARRRFVLALLALVAALVLFSSAFLWDIHVTGNETVPTGAILRALEECGFSYGKCWLPFQSQALQSELLCRLPELEWVSFQIRGSRAEVIVYEAASAPEVIDNDEPVDLIAAQSGIVVKTTVLQGQSMVQRGEWVQPGQVLVSGVVEDRQGDLTSAHALGSIRARTYYEITACLPGEAARRVPAGRSRSRFALVIGKKRINLYRSSGIPTGECDTIYHEFTCAVPGVFHLPVTFVREERRPVELQSRARTEQEAREILERALREELAQYLGADGEIVDLRLTERAADDAYYLTLRAECEQNIERESFQKGN